MLLRRSKPLLLVPLLLLALRAIAGGSHGPYHAVSSADPQWRPNGAHLTLGSALHIAEAEAERNQIRFSDYQSPWYWYDCTHGYGCAWVFIYEGKVPAPGNDFMVTVDDRTQHAAFAPGE
jgi:hypothetical protein